MVSTRSQTTPNKQNALDQKSKFLIGTAISGRLDAAIDQAYFIIFCRLLPLFIKLDILDAAVYQNSGDVNSQWDHFVGRRWFYDTLPTISNGDTIGNSCDFWNMCDPATPEIHFALTNGYQLL